MRHMTNSQFRPRKSATFKIIPVYGLIPQYHQFYSKVHHQCVLKIRHFGLSFKIHQCILTKKLTSRLVTNCGKNEQVNKYREKSFFFFFKKWQLHQNTVKKPLIPTYLSIYHQVCKTIPYPSTNVYWNCVLLGAITYIK